MSSTPIRWRSADRRTSTTELYYETCPLMTAAAFSPDGRQLTFGGEGRGNFGFGYPDGVRDLTIANANGRAARHLAQQTADDEQPAFLPGGQTLVFAGRSKPGAPFDLYTVTSSGTGLTQLTSSGAQQPAPCANGSIAFVHRGDVYLLTADHRTQRRLTLRGGNSPDCSPDGRWIAPQERPVPHQQLGPAGAPAHHRRPPPGPAARVLAHRPADRHHRDVPLPALRLLLPGRVLRRLQQRQRRPRGDRPPRARPMEVAQRLRWALQRVPHLRRRCLATAEQPVKDAQRRSVRHYVQPASCCCPDGCIESRF